MALVLAGDMGGTKTRLALFTMKNGKLKTVAYEMYRSSKFKNFETIVVNFIKALDVHPDVACFGVAGPVIEGTAKITHLNWKISEKKLSKATKIKNVKLVNDFEAAAHGLEILSKRDFVKIKSGKIQKKGTKAMIGAGTGLGEALLVWTGIKNIVVPSEGGHSDFSAKTDFDWRLRQHIVKKHGFCDWDVLLSGKGLSTIYHFLSGRKAKPEEITSSKERLAKNAIELFTKYYGNEAGNLALKAKSTGGVYIVGGIANNILKSLKSKAFRDSFVNKDQMQHLLKEIPVFVIKNEKVGLLGAARLALMI